MRQANGRSSSPDRDSASQTQATSTRRSACCERALPQYRVLYLQDCDVFVLFTGSRKTSDRDLERAVSDAEKHLADYRSE